MLSFFQSKKSGFISELRQIIFVLFIVFLIRTFFFGLYQVPSGSMETTMLVGERFFADKFTYLFSAPKKGHIISLNSPLFNYSSNTLVRLFQEYVWGPQNLTKRIIAGPNDEVWGKIEDGKPVIYLNGKKLDEPYLNKYPLIDVWKRNPREIQKDARLQGIKLLSQNQLSSTEFEEFMKRKINDEYSRKSYDPSVPFEKQPFYRIKESLVVKDENGNPLLLYPGTVLDESKIGAEPPMDKNYWDRTDVFHVKLGSDQYWLMGDNRLNSADSRMFGPISRHLIHGRIVFRILSIDSDDDWIILDLLKHPLDFWKRIRWNRFFQFLS